MCLQLTPSGPWANSGLILRASGWTRSYSLPPSRLSRRCWRTVLSQEVEECVSPCEVTLAPFCCQPGDCPLPWAVPYLCSFTCALAHGGGERMMGSQLCPSTMGPRAHIRVRIGCGPCPTDPRPPVCLWNKNLSTGFTGSRC